MRKEYKPWSLKRKIVFVLLCLFAIIVSIIIFSSSEKQPVKEESTTKIGYLSLVENDGTCTVGPVALWNEPNGNKIKSVVKKYDALCSGGVRVQIEKEEGDWSYIIVSDAGYKEIYKDVTYGWVPKDLVKTRD